MIIWTHIYDLLAKLSAFLIMIVPIVLSANAESFTASILLLILGIAATSFTWWFLLRPLSSYLYAKNTLGGPITFQESKGASCLFSPIKDMTKWHHLKHVCALPKEHKMQAIWAARDELISHEGARASDWRNAPTWAKAARVILVALLPLSMLGGYFNLWPFYYSAILQTQLFGGIYYPIISAVLCGIPFGIALKLIERKLGIRPT